MEGVTEVVTGSYLLLCRAEVQALQLLSCHLYMLVCQGYQSWYPMTVVASLSAIPQSCRTPLQFGAEMEEREILREQECTHTGTPKGLLVLSSCTNGFLHLCQ